MAALTRRAPEQVRPQAGRFDPFAELDRLQEQLDRYTRALDPWGALDAAANGAFIPLADVEETEDAWVVEIELSGVRKDDVDIEVRPGRLVVSGERREKQRIGKLRRRARRVGQFHFELTVPDEIDADHVQASLEHGVLSVRLPKASSAKPHRIAIT